MKTGPNTIKIQYYRKSNYGVTREYIVDAGQAQIVTSILGGQKTIDSRTRELFRDLTGGLIVWEEVLPPA